MIASLKNIVSPKMILAVNEGIYHFVKLSLFVALYSLPWTLVNLFIAFRTETFFIYMLAFLFVLPNILTGLKRTKRGSISFSSYFKDLRKEYLKKMKLSLLILLTVNFYLLDSVILVQEMKQTFLFPLLALHLIFLITTCLYYMAQVENQPTNWRMMLKKAIVLSWRHLFTSFIISVVFAVWLYVGYFSQVVNIVLGNGFFIGIIGQIVHKRLGK